MNCALPFAMVRRSRWPLLSMNLISLRSTMQARSSPLRWFFFQRALSTPTQGAVRRPCSVHLSSDEVSLKLIFNMLFSFKACLTSQIRLRQDGVSRRTTSWRSHSEAMLGSDHAVRPAEAEEYENRN